MPVPRPGAIEKAMISLKENDGLIDAVDDRQIDLEICAGHLRENQSRRNKIE